MSLVQQPTRKRKRTSFGDWNAFLQGTNRSFIHGEEEQNIVDDDASSVIVLDSDVEDGIIGGNYELKKPSAMDFDDDEFDDELTTRVSPVVEDEEEDVIFIKESLIQTPIHVGLKKRRTNSLPQLPLSQISYRRVSESAKIGEIKPNLIIKSDLQINTSFNLPLPGEMSNNSSFDSSAVKTNSTISTSLSPISSIKLQNKITDENGYYIAEPGELFANGRFKILGILGQGTFGKVIKAIDLNSNETVAIKIIRAIPKYREASKIELRILTTLKNADPENLNNCIHLREVLDYENHICIITDLLDISLYEFLQKNNFKPFPGSQIQAITRQLIRSIAFLHDLKLIHTDLKPENILLTCSDFLKFKKNKLILKNPLINIIDFGSAIFNDEYHSELVSTRHYRAPEIVLGIGWSFPCDLWSLGCILVELVTGEALFNTHENSEHLAIMEKVIGEKIPNSIINKSSNNIKNSFFKKELGSNHNYILNFPKPETTIKSKEFVSNLKKIDDLICSKLKKLKVSIDIKKSVSKNWEYNKSINKKLNHETFKFWYYFIDLVYKLLKFDPSKRITAIEALNHKWWDYGVVDEATSSML